MNCAHLIEAHLRNDITGERGVVSIRAEFDDATRHERFREGLVNFLASAFGAMHSPARPPSFSLEHLRIVGPFGVPQPTTEASPPESSNE